jgi:hypothetical protein
MGPALQGPQKNMPIGPHNADNLRNDCPFLEA